ncbi:unnamed protein product [Pleuronectes platessa]|uniref:Uncharacterized protein n=1 Tax=Pleuronectes platessa TaxID=8262 RepID=A0A9N7VIW2_PLEPL|nr:unnamed protein product [Pleuronectes platessa]
MLRVAAALSPGRQTGSAARSGTPSARTATFSLSRSESSVYSLIHMFCDGSGVGRVNGEGLLMRRHHAGAKPSPNANVASEKAALASLCIQTCYRLAHLPPDSFLISRFLITKPTGTRRVCMDSHICAAPLPVSHAAAAEAGEASAQRLPAPIDWESPGKQLTGTQTASQMMDPTRRIRRDRGSSYTSAFQLAPSSWSCHIALMGPLGMNPHPGPPEHRDLIQLYSLMGCRVDSVSSVGGSLRGPAHVALLRSEWLLPLFLTCALCLPRPVQPCSALRGPVCSKRGPLPRSQHFTAAQENMFDSVDIQSRSCGICGHSIVLHPDVPVGCWRVFLCGVRFTSRVLIMWLCSVFCGVGVGVLKKRDAVLSGHMPQKSRGHGFVGTAASRCTNENYSPFTICHSGKPYATGTDHCPTPPTVAAEEKEKKVKRDERQPLSQCCCRPLVREAQLLLESPTVQKRGPCTPPLLRPPSLRPSSPPPPLRPKHPRERMKRTSEPSHCAVSLRVCNFKPL